MHTADSVIRFFIIVTSTRILMYLAYTQENIKMNSIAGGRHRHSEHGFYWFLQFDLSNV